MRTLSTLSGATVHELRGAANSLALHLQLLNVEPETDEVRERQKRSLALADAGRRRLFDLAEVFVRSATVPDTREAAFDLAAVAADAVALARPYAVAQRRVEVAIERDRVIPPVTGRRDAVAQAILELLLHLLDRSEHGAKIEVVLEQRDLRGAVVVRTGVAADAGEIDRIASTMQWAGGSASPMDDGSVRLELPAAPATE